MAGFLGAPLWQHRTRPFPHWLATDVFSDAVYRELEADFLAWLDSKSGPDAQRFAPILPTSEALGMLFTPRLQGPLSVFLSASWRDLIGEVTGARLTDHVSGALHHHAAGDPDGFIHNDLVAGWFVRQPREDGIIVADHTVCRYGTGRTHVPGVAPERLVRAVAILFYLANPAWTTDDGGGTGLYAHRDDAVREPVATVPPVNNSLLVFACTPFSFHTFLSNPRRSRNSVAMWFHRTPDDAVAEWGEPGIARAQGPRPRRRPTS